MRETEAVPEEDVSQGDGGTIQLTIRRAQTGAVEQFEIVGPYYYDMSSTNE